MKTAGEERMHLRQRKILDQDEPSESSTSRTKKTTGQFSKKYVTISAVLGVLFLGYVILASDLQPIRLGSRAIDSLAFSLNWQNPFYVVVIDAGSTGTRILAFSFHETVLHGDLVLDAELFYETKPGLSSFSERPHEIPSSTLEILLEKAKVVVPKSQWHRTPLSMKATAGLRLLDKSKAERILEECRLYFEKSGFQISKNSISIMEGTDEGIFAWFTVNFLLDRLNVRSMENTVAALDLGGGSAQVTYAPDDISLKHLEGHVYSINAFSHNMSIYTHSYLGMGLMASRKSILTRNLNAESRDAKERIVLRSECVNPIISAEWSYGGVDYLVKGPVNETHKVVKTQNFVGDTESVPIVRFADCLKAVEQHVRTISEKPVGLKFHEIYAFSYFFDRAAETALIDPYAGGIIKVESFLKAAMKTCEIPNAEQPFMCLDLTYIYVLLRDGFNLEPTTKVYVYKKINGHELSWALGAAFNILQSGL